MKSTTTRTALFNRIGKNRTLIAVVILLVANSLSGKCRGKTYHISRETEKTREAVHFVYVSEIGGMVGGFTSTSNSQYIGATGLVQVSKEETNGVLHMLKIGHTDTKAFFDDFARNYKSQLPKRKSSEPGQARELSEYYAPQTLICYSIPKQNNVICNYYGKNETIDDVRDFVNKIGKIIAQSELSLAEAGLYVRAQRIPEADLKFIVPDMKLKNLSSTDNKKLLDILKNEMALVRIGEEIATVELANKVMLLPDKPIYIQIEKQVYLLVTYRYKG